jgi:putative membrane protein insertion efficiency factor
VHSRKRLEEEGEKLRFNPGQRVALFALVAYKSILSPIMPSACKFYPTCSMYAKEAVERHGVMKGSWLAAKRLIRCRPFARGGFDPVPDA